MKLINYHGKIGATAALSLGKLDSALQRNPLYYLKGERRYEVVVKDIPLGTRLTAFFREHREMSGHVFRHKRFSRRIRARVYASQLVYGNVVTVMAPLPFYWSKTSITIGNAVPVLSELNLRLSRQSRRTAKTVSRSWVSRVKGPRPSPQEDSSIFPGWDMDNNGVVTLVSQGPFVKYHRDYTSVNTANYTTLARQHRLPVNPHHVQIYRRFDLGDFHATHFQEGGTHNDTASFRSWFGNFGGSENGPNPAVSHNSVQRNKAIDRLMNNVRGETSNLAESVATIRRTFEMVDNTVGRINRSIRYLRRGHLNAAAGELFHGSIPRYRKGASLSNSKSLANNWLELQYGWKPLLADIRYSIFALGKLALNDRTVGTSRASATYEKSDGAVTWVNNVQKPVVGSWYIRTTTTTKFAIRYRVSNPLRAFMSQSGFTNPVSLAWELLPFSFVVDWFYPIGSYLESIDAWGGLELLDGSETTFTRQERGYQKQFSGRLDSDTRFYTNKEGAFFMYAILLDRSKITSFPSPRIPSLKNPFSFEHTLNGLALMRQLFR
jgi:hypothetical protein